MRGMPTGERASRANTTSGQRALAVCVLMALAASPAQSATPACMTKDGLQRAVVKIIDGESVELDDQSEVRLAGILAPEPPDADLDSERWPPAREAMARLEALVLGRSVTLYVVDKYRDRYGRQLAFVAIEHRGASTLLQQLLVAEGLARVHALAIDAACMTRLLQEEERARKAERGLWAHSAYAVRQAWRTSELARFRHTFQIVEGEVRTVAVRRKRVFLNFGRDWRSDFTIAIAGRDRRRFETAGIDFARLEGARIRVRGFIETWNGPMIRATRPEQIEVLAKARPKRGGDRQ
jgi:endonuclease YncB( thermonuclease family)